MKTRVGWVSNSSSSSFCLLGVTEEEIDLPEDLSVYDLEDGDSCITVLSGISEYYDSYCIGMYPHNIGDTETLLQAKARVVEGLAKKGVEISIDSIGFMTDGGYDG